MIIREQPGTRNFVTTKDINSTNTDLAAALAAMGVQFDTKPATIVTGEGISGSHRITYYFHEKSDCGRYETAALIKAWEDNVWHLKNPEHPFAYIKCALQNRERLIDKVKRDVPLGLVKRGKKIGLISLDASRNLEDRFFRRLG